MLNEIKSMEKEVKQLERLILCHRYGVESRPLSGMPRSGKTGDPTGESAAEKSDLIKLWDERIAEIHRIGYQIEKEMKKLCSLDRRIMRHFYFQGWSDLRIGREIRYSREGIARRRKRAVEIVCGERDPDSVQQKDAERLDERHRFSGTKRK